MLKQCFLSSKVNSRNDTNGHELFMADRAKIIKPQYWIVLIYCLIGGSWILFSDSIVLALFEHKAEVTLAQNLKGLLFVIITGSLLFLLITLSYRQIVGINQRLLQSYEQTVRSWITLMDQRHQETRNHSERVMRMCLELAKLSGRFGERGLELVKCGALLHDIGKIAIPDHILTKPDKLDADEWAQMETHPHKAKQILEDIDFLRPCIDIPYQHHERWDGTGYPQGLKNTEIAFSARLFAIVDVWDAIYHARVYKEAWPEQNVLDYLASESGKAFDPDVVSLFLDHYAQLKQVAGLDD